MDTAELFSSELENLIGKECWGVVGGPGTGSVLSLSIGEKHLKKVPSRNEHLSELVKKYDPEYSLMVHCPWRIENTSEVYCGSHHSNENDGPYQSGFGQIIGLTIVSVVCAAPAFDLRLVFSNETSINVVCASIGMDENECYSLGSPSGWFGVCFDGQLELEKNA